MRSRVTRSLEGVTFEQLVEIMKNKLVTPSAPPEFRRAVKSRELQRRIVSDAARMTEGWLFSTEINSDAVPKSALDHVCRNNGPMGFGPLVCHEIWHVEGQEARAGVEISTAPAGGAVIIVLRVDIVGPSGNPAAPGLDVDGRLYARPREHGAVLPLGLVEELTEAHHVYAERLRDVTLALANEAVGGGVGFSVPPPVAAPPPSPEGSVGAEGPLAPAPVVQWPFPERRAPSWAAEGPSMSALKAGGPVRPVDASMLMQVAERI